MLSSNMWDVSHLIHEERLQKSKQNLLIRQLTPRVSPLLQVRKVLSRILFFL